MIGQSNWPSTIRFLPILLLLMAACTASQAITQAKLNQWKVMNYYPSANGWTNMWLNWHPNVIDHDFATIASLNANTVRVIVNVEAFGFPDPSPVMLNELSQMVTLATDHGLQVQLTLFDFWSGYTDAHSIANSKTWASAVVRPYANDPRVAFIELQNEIDPTNAGAMKWAKAMIPYLRTIGVGIPVTVSITDGTAGGVGAELPILIAALGTAQPDFYDVHQYYDAPYEDYYQISLALKVASSRCRPLFVGETGASTNATDYINYTFPQTRASYEAWQDYYLRSALVATSALKLPAAAPWILLDFQPGSLRFLGLPDNSDQYNFGLYRADGTAKPSAASVSRFFGTDVTDASFNSGFEQYDYDPASGYDRPLLWQVYAPSLGNFRVDTTVSHTGNASAEIWHSSSSPQGEPSFYITPIANIVAGRSYTATVFAKGQEATGTTQICLAWFGTQQAYLGQSCTGSLSGTTSWIRFSVSSAAPSGVAYAQIYLASYNNTGAAWFDDVTFQCSDLDESCRKRKRGAEAFPHGTFVGNIHKLIMFPLGFIERAISQQAG